MLLRLVWLLFGNLVLIACAGLVAKGTAPVATDLAYASVAVGLILVRYVDIALFKGHTSDGKPATLSDWRRYAALMAVVSAGVWGLARLVASRGWL